MNSTLKVLGGGEGGREEGEKGGGEGGREEGKQQSELEVQSFSTGLAQARSTP